LEAVGELLLEGVEIGLALDEGLLGLGVGAAGGAEAAELGLEAVDGFEGITGAGE